VATSAATSAVAAVGATGSAAGAALSSYLYAANYAVALASTTASVVGGAVGGAVGGLIASGGDIKAGLIGAVTGAAFAGVGAQFGSEWSPQRVLSTATVGGASSELQGGKFIDGFVASGITTAARYAYNEVVNYDISFRSGGAAVSKWDPLSMPVEGANNIGTAGGVVDKTSTWGEGGVVSKFANNIPGVNAVAGMHDVFQVKLQEALGVTGRNVLNVPGMPIAAALTAAGSLSGMPSTYLINNDEKRK